MLTDREIKEIKEHLKQCPSNGYGCECCHKLVDDIRYLLEDLKQAKRERDNAIVHVKDMEYYLKNNGRV